MFIQDKLRALLEQKIMLLLNNTGGEMTAEEVWRKTGLTALQNVTEGSGKTGSGGI